LLPDRISNQEDDKFDELFIKFHYYFDSIVKN